MADYAPRRMAASSVPVTGLEDPVPRFRVATGRRNKLEPMLSRARGREEANSPLMPGSIRGDRLCTPAVAQEDLESRLLALEAQHGIETPQASRGPSRAPSAPGSRVSTGRPVSGIQSAGRNVIGTPARPPSNSQSAPTLPTVIELEPALPVVTEILHGKDTRKVMYKRSPSGSFVNDVPDWSKDSACAPVLPSRHRYISNAMWMSINPFYEFHEEVSDYRGNLVDHKILGPPVRAFMNPRDKNTLYNEEQFKFGNQQIMRKNKNIPSPDKK